MKVTSINQHISDRPGYKIINAGAVEGFFLIYYQMDIADHVFKVAATMGDPLGQMCAIAGCKFSKAGHPELLSGPVPKLTVYYNGDGREVFTIEE